MLAAWARMVHRRRAATLALSGALLIAAVAVLARGADFHSTNAVASDSTRAGTLIGEQLPHGAPSFTLVASSNVVTVDDPRFGAALQAALAPLRSDSRVVSVTTPYDRTDTPDVSRISTDRHRALVTVAINNGSHATYRALRERITSPTLDLAATGDPAVESEYDRLINDDAARGERLSIPLSLLLLLSVFGGVVAALLPVGVAVLAATAGLAAVTMLATVTDVDSAATNVVIFLGIGLGIDYSFFVVARFREELHAGRDVESALVRTLETAGRAVIVSGLAVAIGLSGLLWFAGTFLANFGFAVMAVVVFAALGALTFLPAVLSILGPRVNRGRLWRRRATESTSLAGMWHRLAMMVMRHPVAVLAPCVVLLLLPIAAFAQIRIGTDHLTALPADAETRRAAELIRADFPAQQQTTAAVVVEFDDGAPLAPSNVGALYDLSRRLERIPGVLRVDDIVPADRGITRAQYQALYAAPLASLPAQAQDAVRRGIGTTIAVARVEAAATERSDAARQLVHSIRDTAPVPGARLLVTGETAFDVDFVNFINHRIPLALGFVLLATYLVLLLLFGSLLLPLKAVVMNLLSITTSFGALVFVFQQGHLSGLLSFTPAPIDPALPIILFCILFGLSMDYEVFLLTRIQEEYLAHGDNRAAVAMGLERSGRVVTGAALIMVVVVACFGLGRVEIIKIIGLGMALAIFVDATIVRALVVPAFMRLMGPANWWSPLWVSQIRRGLGLRHPGGGTLTATTTTATRSR